MSTSTRANVFPVLRYRHAPAAIDWLVTAFGFEKQHVHANENGSIAHAELRLGSAVIGLSSAHDIPGNPWSAVQQGIYVHLEDVDAHHARAEAAGAEIVMPLTDMDYGSREYGARDLDGHLWGFGTYDMSGPGGEAAVFPELRYRDGGKAIAWLESAFGFEKMLAVPGPNGAVVHAEMKLGAGVLMLGSGDEAAGVMGDSRQCTNVYVADPGAHFARAKSAGAAIVLPLRDTPWGSRAYAVRDIEGLLWGFSDYRPRA